MSLIEINDKQKQAIETINGQMIIVACPGSGKTTTLINRIHYMTSEMDIDPSSILMVTFTKAAAVEMKERYLSLYGRSTSVYFGTIHSFCRALILKFAPERMAGGIVSDEDVTNLFMRRLRNARNIGNKLEFINDVRLDISVYKNSQSPLRSFKPRSCKDKDTFYRFCAAYEDYKEDAGVIDFDDMLLIAYNILSTNEEALKWIRSRYRYIMVDEYQDINELQRDIIYLIAGEDGNLAVVGDDDQAIYGFRGASNRIMLSFKDDYPNARVFYLEDNYRSNSEIIDRADSLIGYNKNRFDKNIIAANGPGGNVHMEAGPERSDEIDMLVCDIKEDIDSGIAPTEISVIYRINKQGTMVAKALFEEGIEFTTNDSITGIYDHWIYNDILAFVRMAYGTGSKYDFEQTLNHPNRYLFNPKLKQNGPDMEYMIKAMYSLGGEAWKQNNSKLQIENYFATLKAIRNAKTPGDAVKALIITGNYRRYLSEYADFRDEDESELQSVLTELKNEAMKCVSFDEWDAMAKAEKRELIEAAKGKTGITLTTMHSAKGLEWDKVYIIDCIEGKCPYTKAKTEAELEEERRLFYVAMTRARKNLVLMRPKADGEKKFKPSPYLYECGALKKKY